MTKPTDQLARIDIARFRRSMADPINAEVVASLDGFNAAEAGNGFVWRLMLDRCA